MAKRRKQSNLGLPAAKHCELANREYSYAAKLAKQGKGRSDVAQCWSAIDYLALASRVTGIADAHRQSISLMRGERCAITTREKALDSVAELKRSIKRCIG